MNRRRATIVEVRPVRGNNDGHLAGCAWVAVDSAGRKFGAGTAHEARRMAETYNGIRQSPRPDISAPPDSTFSDLA